MTRTQQSAPMQGQGSVGGIGMGMALDNSVGQSQGQHFMQQQSMSVGSRASYGNGQQGAFLPCTSDESVGTFFY